MTDPDVLASWRRKATPELLAACNEIEELQRLAENNGRAAVAHRAGEDILQRNIDALVAEKDALEQENARLTEHIASVVATARARDEEMLNLRDTHKASSHAQTRGHAWEEAAYEVRKIADLLEGGDR